MIRIKNYFLIFTVLSLAACVSPAAQMSPEQLSTLSNQQLCNLKNNYLWDQNTEIEVGRRNLNCDPIYNECLLRGADSDPEMALCMNQIREQQAMQRTINQQQAELDIQRRRNDMIVQSQQAQARNQVIVVQQQKNASPFCPTFPYCN